MQQSQRLLSGISAISGFSGRASMLNIAKTRLLYCTTSKSDGFNVENDDELPSGLVRESMPKHVAVILDGNRRWCKSKGIDISFAPLYDTTTLFAQLCAKWSIPFATSFIFGAETWKRPKELNDLLFRQLKTHLEDNLEKFRRHEIRVTVIGEISRLPSSLQEVIKQVDEATKNHTRVHLILAVSYGGRSDIVQAIRRIVEKIKAGVIEPQHIDEDLIEKELLTSISGGVIPDPDLMIRTGRLLRSSNFQLWQMAFTELYFTDIYAPDFEEADFIKALQSFQKRERHFGN